MKLEFTPDLVSGNAVIDEQHKALIDAVDKLGEAIENKTGLDQTAETIRFLSEYVIFHFAGEEAYMASKDYAGLEAHKALHADFTAKVNKLYSDWMLGGRSNFALVEEVYDVSKAWLVDHIKGTDLAMIAELK